MIADVERRPPMSLHRIVLILTALLAVAGCGIMNAPLANIDPGGRAFATVDADKLACWQAAEAGAGGAHSRTRWMMAPVAVSAAMQATSGDELAERDKKIEADAEACMVGRGYTVQPK